jgi:hypothetical protein
MPFELAERITVLQESSVLVEGRPDEYLGSANEEVRRTSRAPTCRAASRKCWRLPAP